MPPRVEVPDIMLHEMVADVASRHPGATAITFMGEGVSYARLYDEILRAAEGLRRLGVGEGGCVALLMPNVPNYVVVSYAAMALGARACLLNPLWSPLQVEENVEKLGADVVVFQDVLADRVSELAGNYKLVAARLDDYGSISFKAKVRLGRLLGRIPRPPRGAIEYRELLAHGRLERPYKGDPGEAVAAMLYTGGTTGTPKAVMLTHKNIMANIIYQRVWFNRREASDRVLGLLPLFHAYGFGSILGLSLNIAANLILVPRFEPHKLVDVIVRHRINLIPGAPTVYIVLLKEVPREKLARLRGVAEICFSGAAPLPVEIIKRWESITGCRIVEGYGLTETSPVVAANPIYGKRKHGSIGLPMPNTLLATADLVEPRLVKGTGELVVSGLQVMKGYYNMPEENEKAFFECCGRRWLRTGDIGYMDEEGYFYIVDRKKDIIKYKGHSVYPRYIEEVLYQHECVAEAAVIGVPDPVAGENIKAFIVLRPECRGKVTERDIIEWSKERLGAHEYPRLVEFRDSLPKNPAGKILRRILREEELRRLASRGGEG
ncbi:MAG: AMP-binding protein, partial [Desulfurococcales archaeon]|nr:AMP-binding protein [Desulfurococcales archaeon]